MYIALTLYTLHHFRADYARLLQSLCVDGILVAGVHKLYVAMRHSASFAVPLDQLCAVYASNPNGRRQRLLGATVAEAWRWTWRLVTVTVVGTGLYALWPVYAFVWRGEREMLMCLVCPGIDYTSLGGWATMNVWQVAAAAYGVSGNLVFDLYVQVVVCGHRSLVALLADGLNELGVMWGGTGGRRRGGRGVAVGCERRTVGGAAEVRRRRAYLRNLLMSFQEADG